MRSFVTLVLTTLLVVGTSGRVLGCSQCMCGTPFPADVLGGVVPMQFTYGLEERYLSKANALDEAPGTEKEHEHRIAGFALWRPMNNIALLGRMPFNLKEITSHPIGEVSSRETSRGLGDAEVLVLAGLLHASGRLPLSVGLVAGASAPTGSNDAKRDDGERLDAHLQPGAGAWSGTAGVHVALTAPAGVWDASLLGRTSGTSAHGYRYGDAALYNAGFTSRGWRGMRLLAQVNGRVAKKDRLEDGTMGENTGGTVTYLAPGLRWSSPLGPTAEGSVQFPVAQSLYGEQTEHATGRLTLSISR